MRIERERLVAVGKYEIWLFARCVATLHELDGLEMKHGRRKGCAVSLNRMEVIAMPVGSSLTKEKALGCRGYQWQDGSERAVGGWKNRDWEEMRGGGGESGKPRQLDATVQCRERAAPACQFLSTGLTKPSAASWLWSLSLGDFATAGGIGCYV